MSIVITPFGSHRHTWTTGAVTTVAAGSASAGHLLALRSATTGKAIRIRTFEPEFILTTAFGAAQEVGFDAIMTRGYDAAHTDGTALTMTGGRSLTAQNATILTGRIATTTGLTNGTHVVDANPVAKGSQWCSAIGASLAPRLYDFTSMPLGGLLLGNLEGFIVRNAILMGATGVGKWHFTLEWDDCVIS
jgi:hypothetical protein